MFKKTEISEVIQTLNNLHRHPKKPKQERQVVRNLHRLACQLLRFQIRPFHNTPYLLIQVDHKLVIFNLDLLRQAKGPDLHHGRQGTFDAL